MVTIPTTQAKLSSVHVSTACDDDQIHITDTKCPFMPIERLQDVGINVSDINKLKSAGICTVLAIIQNTKRDLCNIKGLTEAKVDKLQEAAAKLEVSNTFISASELSIKRKAIIKINTGSKLLNELLGGGIETMAITEIFGENRAGKTQICHTLCVTGQISCDDTKAKICYIDTEGTFRPEKIQLIASRYKLDAEETLNNILYARAFTNEHIINLIATAALKMTQDRFIILIIDSIMSLFRVDFSGRGELAERQQKLNKLLSSLLKLSEQFNIAILLTNHVMSEPSGAMSFVANPIKPVGGHVLGHASTCRLSLRKGKGDQRICKVYDSPSLPEGEAVFQLSDQGIIDVED